MSLFLLYKALWDDLIRLQRGLILDKLFCFFCDYEETVQKLIPLLGNVWILWHGSSWGLGDRQYLRVLAQRNKRPSSQPPGVQSVKDFLTSSIDDPLESNINLNLSFILIIFP